MNLENDGERMDINYYNMNYNFFDIYQKSHYKRYEMAKTQIEKNYVVADMACGSGYGSLMLSENCAEVHGVDIDVITIDEISKRYSNENKINFHCKNILDIDFENKFDAIISFETVEHFDESEIDSLMKKFHTALKENGFIIFSTPYNQPKTPASMKWHKTFNIVEQKMKELINGYFEIESIWYQDYQTHILKEDSQVKDFIICKAKKI